mmetsp:Transcript_30565/g.61091  ORF Transcript_30565/g.61091 Transcript_30565/m.61091 type:complete len:114 (+) Transcript_30565:2363-2704(+)
MYIKRHDTAMPTKIKVFVMKNMERGIKHAIVFSSLDEQVLLMLEKWGEIEHSGILAALIVPVMGVWYQAIRTLAPDANLNNNSRQKTDKTKAVVAGLIVEYNVYVIIACVCVA